jgi:RHS repeat-associated protein
MAGGWRRGKASRTNLGGAPFGVWFFKGCGFRVNFMQRATAAQTHAGSKSDTEVGLYYYRARYYDTAIGRLISEDPIAFTGGIDFYAYVSNNPSSLFDPSGLAQVCCRPANVGFAASWAQRTHRPPPCHCFAKLSNGDTLGGYFSYWLPVMLVKRQNDSSDHDKYARLAECKDLPGLPCESDARVKRAFDAYPKVRGPYGTEPGDVGTSNRVAAELLQDSGFGSVLPLPSCAWGQTGADGSFLPVKGFVKGFFPVKIFSPGLPVF